MARVELDIFSGRSNPAWDIDFDKETQLKSRLSLLPDSSGKVTIADLGYRGMIVIFSTGLTNRFFDSHGLEGRDSRIARYSDPGREIERWLFESGARLIELPVYELVRGLIG